MFARLALYRGVGCDCKSSGPLLSIGCTSHGAPPGAGWPPWHATHDHVSFLKKAEVKAQSLHGVIQHREQVNQISTELSEQHVDLSFGQTPVSHGITPVKVGEDIVEYIPLGRLWQPPNSIHHQESSNMDDASGPSDVDLVHFCGCHLTSNKLTVDGDLCSLSAASEAKFFL